jgi:hypothetical protein
VKAAAGLDAAKAEAREAFGGLTWEEYRENQGIEESDDSEAWEELSESIPKNVKDQEVSLLSPAQIRTMYGMSSAWFGSVSGEIQDLKIQHFNPGDQGGHSHLEMSIDAWRVLSALAIGITAAAKRNRQSILLHQKSGDIEGQAESLEAAGLILLHRGLTSDCARLLGAVHAEVNRLGLDRDPAYEADYTLMVDSARKQLGADQFEALWQAGMRVPFADAVEMGLAIK